MKYTFVTNYRDDDKLRNSLNELAEKTFSINFEDWFNNGFWGDKYIPYSLVDNGKIVANVSVNLMDFNMDGKEKHYIQLGTVMTEKAYRGQGLSRLLMEKIIKEYKEKVDGIYLFGNDSVLDFYPKFGFRAGRQYCYSKGLEETCLDKRYEEKYEEQRPEPVDLREKQGRERFFDTVRNRVSNSRFSMNNYGLTAFWAIGPMKDNIYYHKGEKAYIIAEADKESLILHDVIAVEKVNLENIIRAFGCDIRKINLRFTPFDASGSGYKIEEFKEEDSTFFYLGEDLKNIEEKKLMFPILSHA